MAFKFACVSLFVCVIACSSILSKASPLSYLRENDQGLGSGFPFQNQPSLTYLNDNNGVNQVQQILPFQNIGFPNGLIYPNNVASTNIINNVNSVNGINTLPIVQYPQNLIQPAIVGGYQNQNQITNTQSAPVQINYGGASNYGLF
ncbi:uncharacterized protein LOC123299730 [Chrysoperla carnea]|uniref:uncharacterized protein LOC123299730 n=1 Tax=Chrysoperla carnea TaxID=189513 RepID=UPI001D06F3DF|nr:uncharacterized protein LOC123299730 [Chrysoperla carnea]